MGENWAITRDGKVVSEKHTSQERAFGALLALVPYSASHAIKHEGYGIVRLALDEKDQQILDERIASLDAAAGPREGDWVRFADGVERRISYIWGDENGEAFSIQTSKGGSYYLGEGYVSMSGSLYSGVKPETLTETDETKDGSVWFFHHDWHTAGGGIDVTIPFRVFTCSLPANG